MISVRGRSQIGEGRGREQALVKKKKGGQALDRQDQLIFSPSGEKPGGGEAWNNHPPWPYLFLLPLMIQTVLQTSSLQFEFF